MFVVFQNLIKVYLINLHQILNLTNFIITTTTLYENEKIFFQGVVLGLILTFKRKKIIILC